MANVNTCILAGHLGRDPEVKNTPNGTAVMSFSLAVNRRVKRGDQWENETDWIPVTHWKPSDFIVNSLHKGSPCLIQGRLQTRQYEKDGQKRTAFEIVAERIDLLGDKQDRNEAPVSAPRSSRQAPKPDSLDSLGVTDDDVPF